MRRALPLALLAASIVGCELTEVTLNSGNRTVVVQSVLNRAHRDQFAILEYSFNGDTTGRVSTRRIIPPGRPQFPIENALVTITHEGGSCDGQVDTLVENLANRPSGLYGGIVCTLQPGAQARLRVVTANGEIVTGETVIPGIESSTVGSGDRTAHLRADTLMDTLPLNRDRDTLRVDLGSTSGRSIQVEGRLAEVPDNLLFYAFADSLHLAVAGNVINPFDNEGSFVFHPGRFYLFTVALGDRNYFDYVRSLSDPITGRGYLNHLQGGIGVFGSVDVDRYMLRISGDQHDQREGTYRIISRTGGADNLNLEFYLDNDPGSSDALLVPISGFIKGSTSETNEIPGGVVIDRSAAGNFGTAAGVAGANPNSFQYSFEYPRPRFTDSQGRDRVGQTFRYFLSATRAAVVGDTFTVALTVRLGNSLFRRATLTGRQMTSGAPTSSSAK